VTERETTEGIETDSEHDALHDAIQSLSPEDRHALEIGLLKKLHDLESETHH
jgi:hypothetical protein